MTTIAPVSAPNTLFQPREFGCIGHIVHYVTHLKDQCLVFKVSVYALTFFATAVLLFSLIGIPLVFLGYEEFVVQREEAKYRSYLLNEEKVPENLSPADKLTLQSLQVAQRELGELHAAHAELYREFVSLVTKCKESEQLNKEQTERIIELEASMKELRLRNIKALERYNSIETNGLTLRLKQQQESKPSLFDVFPVQQVPSDNGSDSSPTT